MCLLACMQPLESSGPCHFKQRMSLQVIFGKWDDILAIEAVPETARGQCPMGGIHYARAIFHYARCLALAAKSAGAATRGFAGDRERLLGLAVAELDLLRVTHPHVCLDHLHAP